MVFDKPSSSFTVGVQSRYCFANEISGFRCFGSSEGKSFQSIAKVKGNGTTTQRHDYFLDDEKPYIGKNYYRLKSVDFDGYT